MPFGEVLKQLRKDKGLTQAELARLTGLKVSAISMYENGNREPNFETLEIFADFFNVDMDVLLGREKKANTTRISKGKDILPGKTERAAEALPPLSPRDERQIARDLEKMLADLDDKNDLAALGGTVEDAEDRELLRASLLTSMRLAKQIAKKKFTPKKYRKDDIE